MNLVGYCRVSTDTSDQLNSLDAQKRFFEEYANKNGHNLVRLYADEGISGTKTKNRKEFLHLMRDAEHGLFEMVVVKDISRFARNTVDLLKNTRQLKALDIETLFLTSNMTVLGNSEFVLTIFGALAQEESANTSKRVKFGKEINAKKGRVPNIIYGYEKTKGDYFNLSINEGEAAIVRRVFDMYTAQGYGAGKIAGILNEEGLKTKRNCSWSQNAISHILKNEIYVGRIINGKEEIKDFLTGVRLAKDPSEWHVVDKPELRLISDETFQKAQDVLASRIEAFKVTRTRESNKHLFSTLIKCADCGWSFRRTVHTYKNTYVRWVCSGRNGKGADTCGNKTTIDESELITSLREYFTNVLNNRAHLIKHVVREFTKIYKSKDENQNYENELSERLTKLKNTRQKYMDMYDDGLISRDEIREKMQTVNAEKEKLENNLKLATFNLSKADQLEEVLASTFKRVEDIVSMETLTNAQLKQIIQKITVANDGKVDIYLRLFSDIGLDENFLISDNRT